MSIAEKLTTVAENQQKVFDAGKKSEYDAFWDAYQSNGNRRNYAHAFAGPAWGCDVFKPKYPIRFNDVNINSRTAYGVFNWHGRANANYVLDLSTIDIDFSGCMSLNLAFSNSRVDNITIDGSNLNTMDNAFNGSDGGNTITTINIKITDKCTSMYNAFNYCRLLTNLIFTEDSVIAANIALGQSDKLTTESIDSIINALQDRTGLSAYKVTFHADVVAKLSEEQMNKILNKGWNVG